jgi:hypothetical protein
MALTRLFLLALACALASCGGGGDGGGGDGGSPPPPDTVTFSFRVQGNGAEQEFRYATSSPALIAKARAQLLLPVLGRPQFPIGPIAAGSGGVNLNWNWHFTDLSFAEAAIELCDGTPALVEADLPYWLNTVKSFCPWGGYIYAEVTGTYPLKKMAVGEVREIAQENMRVEFNDVSDSRCPAAAVCVIAGWAAADLVVRLGTRDPQRLTVTLDAGERDKQTVFAGYQFTLDKLDPYPVSGPAPKEQYRADITVRKL